MLIVSIELTKLAALVILVMQLQNLRAKMANVFQIDLNVMVKMIASMVPMKRTAFKINLQIVQVMLNYLP